MIRSDFACVLYIRTYKLKDRKTRRQQEAYNVVGKQVTVNCHAVSAQMTASRDMVRARVRTMGDVLKRHVAVIRLISYKIPNTKKID